MAKVELTVNGQKVSKDVLALLNSGIASTSSNPRADSNALASYHEMGKH